MSAALVDRIQNARFATSRWRETYSMGEVDEFLDRLAAAVGAGQPVDQLVRQARFSPVRLQTGYDMADVDRFLAQVVTDAAAAQPAPSAEPVQPVQELQVEPAAPQPAGTGSPALVQWIEQARFETVKAWERGYDEAGVDQLLDRLKARAATGEPLAGLVAAPGLRAGRGGYDVGAVDTFLTALRDR